MKTVAPKKTSAVAEFGDFQTPRHLANAVCGLLGELGVMPASIVEPTCGVGGFLFSAADRWNLAKVSGFEINADHFNLARERANSRADAARIDLSRSDFFTTDWHKVLRDLKTPLLVIGNPPWVTNAHVSSLNGSNVPVKSNFQGHGGFDAITGKANFDISEWMLIQLVEAMAGRDAILAMLVKTVVARKILHHCWKREYPLAEASVFNIDASAHFNAAVDASLIFLRFGSGHSPKHANVFSQLTKAIPPAAKIGLAGGAVVADLDAYERTRHLAGTSSLKWRSGIKHDCSKVMELVCDGNRLKNGFGEIVDLEENYLFPMFKTSEIAGGNVGRCNRRMIVPQRRIGDETSEIETLAPKTWSYLQSHRDKLSKRGSSIYRDKPAFSIFGIGDYSFAPYKVAISGMYKSLSFTKVGSFGNKPVVLDDTTNFMPCKDERAASLLSLMLASQPAQDFFRSYIFWDAKRPITVELLARLDLHALARNIGWSEEFESLFGPFLIPSRKRGPANRPSSEVPLLW